jgi:hypothetical protein
MNAGRLHLALEVVARDYEDNEVIAKLRKLLETLTASIDSTDEAAANMFTEALTDVYATLSRSPSISEPPSQAKILEEIGASDKIGTGLSDRIQAVLDTNNVTPANALAELQKIAAEVEHFAGIVKQTIEGFEALHIDYDRLLPGETEFGVLIPWAVIDSNLEGLQKETREFDKALKIVSELVEESPQSPHIRSVGSSNLQLFLSSTPAIAACLIAAVERLCALYKQILEIRSLRKQLREKSLPKELTAPIEAHEEIMASNEIEKIADALVKEFSKVKDKGRENELRNGLVVTLRFFAAQIDAGVDMEARSEPPKAKTIADDQGESIKSPKTKRALEEARRLAARIQSGGTVMRTLKRGGGPVLTLAEGTSAAKKSRKKKASSK